MIGSPVKKRTRILGTTCGAHFIHDGFSDLITILLPIWQAEFGLTLSQVGIISSTYSGAMSIGQLPAGLAAERWGERRILVVGTLLAGAGFCLLGFAGGVMGLALTLVLAGIGSSSQHPLSSTIVARAYENGPMRAALGIYNFSGDLGKMAVPGLAAIALASLDWSYVTYSYGAFGIIAAIGLLFFFRLLGVGAPLNDGPSLKTASLGKLKLHDWGIHKRSGFSILAALSMIDGACRAAFITFLPFLLISKGAGIEAVGAALVLVFAGGAAGKLVCGMIAEHLGIVRTAIISELATAGGIVLLLPLPLEASYFLLPIVGVALNGTSSVLYASVAEFVTPERHSRGFGLFMTLTMGAWAIAPAVFGVFSDLIGVALTMLVVSLFTLTTVPLALGLSRPLRATSRSRSK